MTNTHRRVQRLWVVLLLTIGIALGHVGMMPLQAQANDAASAAPGPGGHDDGGARVVSRPRGEALRTAPAELPPTAVMASTLAPPLPPFAWETARAPVPVLRSESAPLFLLHGALLI